MHARTMLTPQTDLSPELSARRQEIEAAARSYGLDFFEVVFEVLPFDVMNQLAAYGGFPTRYPHWKWGMEYEQISKRDAYGMGRIYEMVVNTDPVYAYLQESNTVTDQKLVMAHVYGHADFFKNNFYFSTTNRKMLDEMANHATRIRRYADIHGAETVERFLDACMSVEGLIDPYSLFMQRGRTSDRGAGDTPAGQPADGIDYRLPAKDYLDKFINPPAQLLAQRAKDEMDRRLAAAKIPADPQRDVLAFLLGHAQFADWQRDILSIIRDEAYYFAPQAMTKIMNEGWASYWHSHLMTHHFCQASEIVHYCDQHSGVIHMAPGGFNPYKIGIELFRDIERRWNTGQHGPAFERLDKLGEQDAFDAKAGAGRAKIFEVRRLYNDVSFIDEFLTPEFVERHKMYQTRRDERTGEVRIVSRDFDRIKQTLLHHLTNRGEPFLYVVDGNYLNRGELYLAHKFSGLEIDAAKAQHVLTNLHTLWGRPVHLQMQFREDMYLFSTETAGPSGVEVKRQRMTDDTPPPAHIVA